MDKFFVSFKSFFLCIATNYEKASIYLIKDLDNTDSKDGLSPEGILVGRDVVFSLFGNFSMANHGATFQLDKNVRLHDDKNLRLPGIEEYNIFVNGIPGQVVGERVIFEGGSFMPKKLVYELFPSLLAVAK